MDKALVDEMNNKGLELAISTLIVIIIGIAVLIGLLIFITKGFGFLKEGTDPLLRASSVGTMRQACELACQGKDSVTFCCNPFMIEDKPTYCKNGSLNLECSYDCSAVVCS